MRACACVRVCVCESESAFSFVCEMTYSICCVLFQVVWESTYTKVCVTLNMQVSSRGYPCRVGPEGTT